VLPHSPIIGIFTI